MLKESIYCFNTGEYMSLKLVGKEPVYTVSELENRFEKLRLIGSGGEGCIYEVKERRTGDVMALKIANNNWRISQENQEIAKIITFILQRGISPHLTQIYELLSVECRVFSKLGGDKEAGFFEEKCEKNEKVFPRRAYLMELLKGSLQRLSENEKGISKKVEMAFILQVKSIQNILASRGVCDHESGKWKNIVYKTVGPEDVFQEKAMIDFDFWKYVFGQHEFYLPRPEYLIKLADYDSWQIRKTKDDDRSPKQFLENYLSHGSITLQDLKEWFKKPENPNAKILEVYNSSKTVCGE
jgi:hypothetical protein